MSSRFRLLLIVASALVPLLGVLLGGWSLREVVVLYWAENVIIGGFQVVRMLTVSPPGVAPGSGVQLGKLATAAFFTVHYGIFCLVHGVFVVVLTSGTFGRRMQSPGDPFAMVDVQGIPGPFWLALLLLAGNHLWDLVERWFLNGRWKAATPAELMAEPYKHIIILHVAIILGAFLAMALGNAIGILVLIVIGKLGLDLRELKATGGNGLAKRPAGAGREGEKRMRSR